MTIFEYRWVRLSGSRTVWSFGVAVPSGINQFNSAIKDILQQLIVKPCRMYYMKSTSSGLEVSTLLLTCWRVFDVPRGQCFVTL